MSTMVESVLRLEREAEAVLENARGTAAAILSDAKTRRAAETDSAAAEIRREIAALEERADDDRAQRLARVSAEGQTALEKVRNISPAAFDRAVQSVMERVAGK